METQVFWTKKKKKTLDGHKHKYSVYWRTRQTKNNKCNADKINHLKYMNDHFI